MSRLHHLFPVASPKTIAVSITVRIVHFRHGIVAFSRKWPVSKMSEATLISVHPLHFLGEFTLCICHALCSLRQIRQRIAGLCLHHLSQYILRLSKLRSGPLLRS